MAHRLEDYAFGRVTLDGRVHSKDLIVFDGGVVANWRRREGHSLCPADLDPVMSHAIKILIVGCGAADRLVVPDETVAWLEQQGVRLIALATGDACDRYNDLCPQGNVAAALHLTC